MNKILKRVFVTTIYFLFWIVVYIIFYSTVYYNEEVILLPQFKLAHKFSVALIPFVRFLPALEISSILILFSISATRHSIFQLKRHSNIIINLITKLFVMCILASFINITMSEIVRPMLIDIKKSSEQLSKKFYENIHNTSVAIEKADYESAEQYVNVALLIWEDNQQAIALKERLTTLKAENTQDAKELQSSMPSHFITIPESIDAKEILNMAKTRIKMLDFYTASHYVDLVLQIAKNNEDLRKEAYSLQKLCAGKIDSGAFDDEMLKIQRQFEAKKIAYDALTQKDYAKAYYAFLNIHNKLLNDGNKYDPDVEKHLEIAKQKLLEEVFFIEEMDDIKNFNSSYPIQFSLKDKNVHFNIGGFYFHTTKNHVNINLSNVVYSMYRKDGTLLSQIKFPYAKIIEKKENDKNILYMLVSASSESIQLREVFDPPINLGMTLEDFNLILLAQKGSKAMTIGDLYKFIPVANSYGFDKSIYQAELSIRFADFFIFIIFTIFLAIIAFNLRPISIDKCSTLLLLACVIFPYPIYVLLESVRYVFKLLITFLINTGIIFPNIITFTLLLLSLIITTYFLYNIGYDE